MKFKSVIYCELEFFREEYNIEKVRFERDFKRIINLVI